MAAPLSLMLLAGCTGSGSTVTPPPPKSPVPISMSYQRIYGTTVDRSAKPLFTSHVGYAVAQHVVVAPDIAAFESSGCPDGLHTAPVGLMHVDAHHLNWVLGQVGGGPDCLSLFLGFVRFSRPVFDMHEPIHVTATLLQQGTRRVRRYVARPDRHLAPRLYSQGPLPWQPGARIGAPACLWDRSATNLKPCEERQP